MGHHLALREAFIGLTLFGRWHVCHLASKHSCPARRRTGLRRAESQAARAGCSVPPSGYVTVFCKLPLVVHPAQGDRSAVQKVIAFAEQLDLIGLVLLGAAVALILLPITLVKTSDQWSDG